jgi:hypothetical protein
MIVSIATSKEFPMITFSLPEGRGFEHWAGGRSVTAQEIHDVLRRGPVRFLIVPRAFSDNEFYRLDVLRLNDPATQARTPPEIYRNGEFSNMFYTADALVGEATVFVWRKIARYLRESANGEDRAVGDAIAERLGDLEGVESEAVMKVELSTPTDWMKRVFAVQDRVSLADDD